MISLATTRRAAWAALVCLQVAAGFPGDVVTIHYHRADKNYAGVNLWTWNGENKKTPANNAIAPVGQDEFGAIFRIDRAD